MAGDVTPIGPKKRRGKFTLVPAHEPGAKEHELRLAGKTWPQIATQLGHDSPASAQQARTRYLQRASLALAKEKRVEAMMLEIERLDTLQAGFWEAATTRHDVPEVGLVGPDPKAAEVVLKIIAQRAKLLGLEEADVEQGPRTVVVTGPSEQYVATLKGLIEGTIVDAELVEDDDEGDSP